MNLLSEYFFLHHWLPTTVQENQAANWAVVNFNFQKGNQAFVSVPIRNIQFITTLERLSESYMMNDHLFCINKCLVRLLKQKVCKKQYTGKTVDKFRLRWNNYTEESDRKFLRDEEIKQKFLRDHFFRDDNHSFEEDLSILTPKKHTQQYIPLLVSHQSYQFNLSTKVCKHGCNIVTLFALFTFFINNVTCKAQIELY